MTTLNDQGHLNFDASLIGSLSLEDTTKFETGNTHFEDQDDDLMEVDDTLEMYDSHGRGFETRDTPEPDTSERSKSLTPLNKLSNLIASPFQSTPLHSRQEAYGGQDSDLSEQLHSSSIETREREEDHSGEFLEPESREDSYVGEDVYDSEREHSTMSSFSRSILSPTSLGAQLAVRRPQLLLDAPYNSHENNNEHYDHEYDTSSFSSIPARRISDTFDRDPDHSTLRNRDPRMRNNTSFLSSSNASSFFANNGSRDYPIENNHNNQTYRYDDSWSGNSLDNNTMSQSFYYRKQNQALREHSSFEHSRVMEGSPVHIHHHHYYSNVSGSKVAPENMSMSIENRSFKQDRSFNSEVEKYEPPQDVKLPLPWESSSSPHERVPYMLSSYLQLMVNIVATGYGFYLIFSIVSVIKGDISNKLHQQSTNMLVEIASCRRSYEENNCSPDQIVPALEKSCAYWLKCMSQDPYKGGNTSSVSAETLGMIMNSLVEPLGYKFFLLMFAFVMLVFVCNFAFGYVRAKAYYGWRGSADHDIPHQSQQTQQSQQQQKQIGR